MRIAVWLAATGALAFAAPARAELPDCAVFPDTHSRFACYLNISRAPTPEPETMSKPQAAKTNTAKTKTAKTRSHRQVSQ
ncbi:hypothetical protein [Bradyrhizobium lablabi]|uniref:hypothetical protein n=1 Tax=Bradyrhizobium lablabi TaxID=722472 RepID=UPI001BA5670B|nr:hypothetical protein [Bradyrhizobium lablabi]MBR0696663.1 hypothetical protein [Bradyrhizobium lablabi]